MESPRSPSHKRRSSLDGSGPSPLQPNSKGKKESGGDYAATHCPCPMLNTLHNAGHIPAEGITPEMLSDAFQKYLGADEKFATTFATKAHAKFLALVQKNDPAATTIALRHLTYTVEEGGIEHYASLSRPDTDESVKPAKGEYRVAPKPDASRVDAQLKLVHKEPKPTELLNFDDMVAIRQSVEQQSGDKIKALANHKLIGTVEICLLRGVLSGGSGGKHDMRADWYRSFLVDEAFPAEFKKPEQQWGFGFVIKCVLKLMFKEGIHDFAGFLHSHFPHVPYLNGLTITDMIAFSA